MTPDNLIDIDMLAADVTGAKANIAGLRAFVNKYAVGLTAAQRQSIATIGPERKAMVTDFMASMAAHPEFVPGYTDMAEVNGDATAREIVLPLYTDILELCDGFGDTVHALGSDLLLAFMGYYTSVQAAAKRNLPGATAVLALLQQHIPRGWKIKPKTPPPAP